MTSLPTGRRGQALAFGVTLLLAAALWLGVLSPLLGWYADRGEVLAQRRTLAARMEQVAATAPALQAQLQAGAARPQTRAVLEGATDAIAGAALQQQVQDMTAQAGATLASTEALPAATAGSYRKVGLRVSVSGSWPVMVALFAAIERATPRMLVDDLQLQPGMLLGAAITHPLQGSFTIVAFHTGSASPP